MGGRTLIRTAAFAVAVFIFVSPVARPQEERGSPRSRAAVTFLQLNDVYSTVPINDVGGLARVATLKRRIRDEGRTPVLVLAGDFLSPSVASAVFKGEQMIAALNAAGLDMATLGNHEFDYGDDVLIERMRAAKWQWLVANVIDRRTGKPIGGASPYVIRTFGTLKVGFIGLCLTTSEISPAKLTHTDLVDPLMAAGQYVPLLKQQGAQVIVAITHLTYAGDRLLAKRFPQIDLVIGGHEHYPITGMEGRTLISKAGSDARWVARIDVVGSEDGRQSGGATGSRRSGASGASSRASLAAKFFELIPITNEIPDEPKTAAVVQEYEERLSGELDTVIGEVAVPLEARSIRLRVGEQPIGNLFADAIRSDVNAEASLINSGSIRGDRVYPAGPLTRKTLLGMHPFGNVVCAVDVTGAVLLAALNNGVAKLPASAGQFPQVSGLTFTVDTNAPPGNRIRKAAVNGQPLVETRRYRVAIPDYVFNGGDGYSMFGGQRVLVGPESGNLLVSAVERFVSAQRQVAPALEGRITMEGR